MKNIATLLPALFVLSLSCVYGAPLIVQLSYLGTGYIHYNEPCGINFTIIGDIYWAFHIDLNGNINHRIKMNHSGEICWKFKRRPSYNKTHVTFKFESHKVLLKPNDTVNYWMFTISKNASCHFLNPKMFTVLGDGNLTAEFRQLDTFPSDDIYKPIRFISW